MRSCLSRTAREPHALSDLVRRGVVVGHGGRNATYELDEDVRYAHDHNDVVIESTGESRERRCAELQRVLVEQLGLAYRAALRRMRYRTLQHNESSTGVRS